MSRCTWSWLFPQNEQRYVIRVFLEFATFITFPSFAAKEPHLMATSLFYNILGGTISRTLDYRHGGFIILAMLIFCFCLCVHRFSGERGSPGILYACFDFTGFRF